MSRVSFGLLRSDAASFGPAIWVACACGPIMERDRKDEDRRFRIELAATENPAGRGTMNFEDLNPELQEKLKVVKTIEELA